MRLGGKHKGSATLPKAAHIDVREEMAAIAGVGSRNHFLTEAVNHRIESKVLHSEASQLSRSGRSRRFRAEPEPERSRAGSSLIAYPVSADMMDPAIVSKNQPA